MMKSKRTIKVTYVAVAVSFLFMTYLFLVKGSVFAQQVTEKITEAGQHEVTQPIKLTITLERVYLDGEMSEEKITETIWSVEDLLEKYDQWHFVEMKEDELVLQRHIDDISPLLKTNGYFGITSDGILTIFNGKPDESNVIQSFFQIDIKKLESKQHEQLMKGIPIKTKANYVDVLDAFQHYSIQMKSKD